VKYWIADLTATFVAILTLSVYFRVNNLSRAMVFSFRTLCKRHFMNEHFAALAKRMAA